MPPYLYSQLDLENRDIRLVTLLPGDFNNDILISLSHKPFVIPKERLVRKLSLDEIQKTLPANYTAFESLEGRIYYDYADPDTGLGPTSWTHPIPEMDPTNGGTLYDGPPKFQAEFEALSYTWGSAENPEVAYIKDPLKHKEEPTTSLPTLRIGQNLACALRHLRYLDRSRLLWVDAICINQQNIEERAKQVVRMGDIYTFARRVVVWLGPSSGNSKLAISTLSFLGKQVEVNKLYGRSPSPDCTHPLWYSAACALPYNDETWEAIKDLLELPWFKRLWVLQEIQLANQDSVMQCGNDKISWYFFRRSIKCLYSKQKGVPSKLAAILPHIDRLSMHLTGSRLQRLLSTSRERLCSESSDKVYAVLGLVPPTIAGKIKPNYSISPAEVYKSTFLEHASLVQRLELLVACSTQSQRLPDLPSWVPDWSGVVSEEVAFFTDSYCTGYSSSRIKYSPPGMLEVVGVRCFTVSNVGESPLNYEDDIVNVIRSVGKEKLSRDSYIAGGSLLDAYAWTLSHGQLRDRFHNVVSTVGPNLEEMRNFILDKAHSSSEQHFQGGSTGQLSPLTRYTKRQKMVSTGNGYIGLSPNGTQPGK
jgi:hypothetical protein